MSEQPDLPDSYDLDFPNEWETPSVRQPPDEEWAQHGLCRTHAQPDLWFPDDHDFAAGREAIAICNTCPVRTDCLQHALRVNETYGIWGGTNAKQRARLRKHSRGAA